MRPFPGSRTAQLTAAAVAAVMLLLVVVVVVRTGRDDDVQTSRSAAPSTTAAGSSSTTDAPSTTGTTLPGATEPSQPSSSATTTPATDAPTTAPATTRPTGRNPAVALRRVAAIEAPSAVVDLPGDGPVLVSTLDGRVLGVDLRSGRAELVLDLRSSVSTGGERGLLGMAADPAGTRLVVNYTNPDGDTEIRSWRLDGGAPAGGADAGVLHLALDQPRSNHNGGHLAFGPDGALWVGTGDGGGSGDPDDVAQDPRSLLGKMLRLELDPSGGSRPAPGNPDWGGRPEVWAIGLRNPWRYSFDRSTGRIWVADVGQNTTEEVSVVAIDARRPNFGWDDMEGDRPFEGGPDPSFVAPVITYGRDAGCAVTGGYVYRGSAVRSLYGWYLFGDYCGGWVRAVPADDPTRTPVELVGDAGSVLSFAELADGELLVLTRDGVHRVVAS